MDELVQNLKEIAKNKEIKDFDMDIKSLVSMEGRMAMR